MAETTTFDLTSLIEYLESSTAQRNYWMVRTMGGNYYGDFIRHGYVAFGYDAVTLENLNSLSNTPNMAKEQLKAIFANKCEYVSQYGYYASQMLHFYREIKVGDVVIIPSISAAHVAIGIVESDVYEEQTPMYDSEHICQFKKRRRVAWKVFCRRGKLPPMLQLVFGSRHPVSNISAYAPYIDSMLTDCYYKDEQMHLVFRIKTTRSVNMDDFFNLYQLKLLAKQYCQEIGHPITEDIDMKIQMESPGRLLLSTKGVFGLLAIGLICVAISGGGVECSREEGLNMYTNGMLESVSDFLDRRADRQLVSTLKNSLDSLKIDTITDIYPYIDLIRARGESRTED